jgi:hypothetical protein
MYVKDPVSKVGVIKKIIGKVPTKIGMSSKSMIPHKTDVGLFMAR